MGSEASRVFCPTGSLDCRCIYGEQCTGVRPRNWPSSKTAHETALRKLTCIISGSPRVTLHHCRGGSMRETPWGTIGISQKQNDALQIPLHADWHVGKHRIDGSLGYSIDDWEERWEPQTELIWRVGVTLGYNLWALAWEWSSQKERELLRPRFQPAQLRRLGLSSRG